MQAIVASAINKTDPLSVFSYTTVAPVPSINPNSPKDDHTVLVKTYAASVNPADIMYIDGTYQQAPNHPLPTTWPTPMGVDGAGVVEAVGKKVTKWKHGDRVMGAHHLMDAGTWAQYSAFQDDELCAVPEFMPWEVAASMPIVWLTGMKAFLQDERLLSYHNQMTSLLKSGSTTPSDLASLPPPVQTILINGGSGGIGSATLLLARHYFRIPHIYTVCSGRSSEYCQRVGAHTVIDYTTTAYEDTIEPYSLDFILDNIGGMANMDHATKLLKNKEKGGTGVYVTSVPGDRNGGLWGVLKFFGTMKWNNLTKGEKDGRQFIFNGAKAEGSLLEELMMWMSVPVVKETLGVSKVNTFLVHLEVFALDQGLEAVKIVKNGKSVGKCVITIPH
ncbi:hypothetical protein HDU78_009132 [Chytriomyces hyalinus]|nr:hypothetical protein HDU78_009132 [Chytriomyces hyalinus]